MKIGNSDAYAFNRVLFHLLYSSSEEVDAVHHMELPFLPFSNQILENLVLPTLLCSYIFHEDESDICSKAGWCLHPEDVLGGYIFVSKTPKSS